MGCKQQTEKFAKIFFCAIFELILTKIVFDYVSISWFSAGGLGAEGFFGQICELFFDCPQ
jgi:hypothetical protein